MTHTSKLIQDLRSALPAIEPALKGANLAQPFEAELVALAESLTKARQVFVEPIKNQVARRNVMSTLASHRKTLERIYASITDRRQEFETAFESFDQKANQLFNILSTVLKSEQEMQSGIERNIL